MKKLDDQLLQSLRPNFSSEELNGMLLYFEVSVIYNDQINEFFQVKLKDHPVFGPIMATQSPEMQKARNELSQTLTRNALNNGEWDAYISDLIMQGQMYANMGMTFSSWYEVIALVKDFMVPHLVEAFKDSQQKMVASISGLGTLTDFAMAVIAESYFIENHRIIEAQQKKKASLIKELENFAYVVSHDLKSPLRGISKISEWLVADYSDKLDETGKVQLELLKSRVYRLDKLIDGILSYSKLGRQETVEVEIDVKKVLEEVVSNHLPDSSLNISLPKKLPILRFDRSKLTQVFSNLISNAIKYADKKPVVIKVGYMDMITEHQFTITDNGPGIEPEYYEKIFGIFQTLHTKDEVESTGIGLSIVKKILEDGNGNISVESELGVGTKFTVYLPKA